MCEETISLYIDILITSRNGDRKITEPIRMTNGPHTRIRK